MALRPGDLCRIIVDAKGDAVAVEHDTSCGRHPAGTRTDVRTGKVIRP